MEQRREETARLTEAGLQAANDWLYRRGEISRELYEAAGRVRGEERHGSV